MMSHFLKESNWDLVIDASSLCSLQCPKCIRNNIKKVPGETLTVDRFKKLIKYLSNRNTTILYIDTISKLKKNISFNKKNTFSTRKMTFF